MPRASSKPVLRFDGECGFCRLWIERWREATGERVDYVPFQKTSDAVELSEPDGRVSRGAEAVFRSLAYAPGGGLGLALYRRLPPLRWISEHAYAFVAARRPFFSRLTLLLWGGAPTTPRRDATRRAFLAGLGLCYLAAFASLGVQVRGLIGRDGILPAAPMLQAVARQVGPLERYWNVPTLAWLSAADKALTGMCAAGVLASLGLVLNLAAGPCALACWALYLSLCAIGADFLSFQWDALLLETGLLALFLAPWSLRARNAAAPPRGAFLLLHLLLFKLMIESGTIKLLSGDPSWRDLTALTYHYWTQPLPNPASWYIHHFPLWFHQASCAVMFAIELGAPWLLLGPRRARAAGAAAIAALMLLIMLTGNYGFFNLLTLVLCLSALDDRMPVLSLLASKTPARAVSSWRARFVAVFAAFWILISSVQFAFLLGRRPPLSRAWMSVLAAVAPLRSINHYGLFAVMTKSRDEVSLEVSADGREWREWPFRWKPGDPRRAPPAPLLHMPRLDWQMWFAAFGPPGQSPWFGNLVYRALQNEGPAVALLGPSPLDGQKPLYARASFWSTTFTTPEQRRADGTWWRRERKGLYFPVVSLKPN